MVKKLFLVVTILSILTGCELKSNKRVDEKESEEENITISIPRLWFSSTNIELNSDYLENEVKTKGYISATLNSDGSVTYILSHDRYMDVLESIKKDMFSFIKERFMKEIDSIIDIQINDDTNEFIITLKENNFELIKTMVTLTIDFYEELYNSFSNNAIDSSIRIVFLNQSGETIEEINSSNNDK